MNEIEKMYEELARRVLTAVIREAMTEDDDDDEEDEEFDEILDEDYLALKRELELKF